VSSLGFLGEGLVEVGLDGEELYGPLRRGYGGDAANAAVMAALMRAPGRLCARVGDDIFGTLLRAHWERCGLDTRYVRVDPGGPTGMYVNQAREDARHVFHYHRRGSAGSLLTPADIADGFLDDLSVLHVTGITLALSSTAADAVWHAVEGARERGALVSLAVNHRPALNGDPAPLLGLLERADIVFISRPEARELLGSDDLTTLGRLVADGCELVVSDGARGAMTLLRGSVAAAAEGLAVEVVDTAGAGDALAGAYLASRSRGMSVAEALRIGVTAGSLSCRGHGCSAAYPSAAEVEERARELAR
jgi:2-dehydro-3-deoxygluconokinase